MWLKNATRESIDSLAAPPDGRDSGSYCRQADKRTMRTALFAVLLVHVIGDQDEGPQRDGLPVENCVNGSRQEAAQGIPLTPPLNIHQRDDPREMKVLISDARRELAKHGVSPPDGFFTLRQVYLPSEQNAKLCAKHWACISRFCSGVYDIASWNPKPPRAASLTEPSTHASALHAPCRTGLSRAIASWWPGPICMCLSVACLKSVRTCSDRC